LITSLETDVIPCVGDDRVPDYPITQLAKVLQQGLWLLQHEPDEDYLTSTSLTQPGKSVVRGGKADSETMGSTEPVRGVSQERFLIDVLIYSFSVVLIPRKTVMSREEESPP